MMAYSVTMLRRFVAGIIIMVIMLISIFYVYVSMSEKSIDQRNKMMFSKFTNSMRKAYTTSSGWDSMDSWILYEPNKGFMYSVTIITNRTAKNLSDYGGEPSQSELKTCMEEGEFLPRCVCLIKFKYMKDGSGDYYHDYSNLNDNNIIYTESSVENWNKEVLEEFLARKEESGHSNPVYKYPKVLSCNSFKSIGCNPEEEGEGSCNLQYEDKNVTMLFSKKGGDSNNLTVTMLSMNRVFNKNTGNWTNTVNMSQDGDVTVDATEDQCLFDHSHVDDGDCYV